MEKQIHWALLIVSATGAAWLQAGNIAGLTALTIGVAVKMIIGQFPD